MSDEFDVMSMVMSGAPVEFEIVEIVKDEDGNEVEKVRKFALRQMTPAERDRLSYLETKEHDRVLAEYRAAGLGEQPMSDDMQNTRLAYEAMLEQTYKLALKTDDMETAKQAAYDLEDTSIWPQSLAHQRANTFVTRLDGRWFVDNLLEGDRAKFNELTRPDPLLHDAVIEAVAKLRKISQYIPNSNGRRQ